MLCTTNRLLVVRQCVLTFDGRLWGVIVGGLSSAIVVFTQSLNISCMPACRARLHQAPRLLYTFTSAGCGHEAAVVSTSSQRPRLVCALVSPFLALCCNRCVGVVDANVASNSPPMSFHTQPGTRSGLHTPHPPVHAPLKHFDRRPTRSPQYDS